MKAHIIFTITIFSFLKTLSQDSTTKKKLQLHGFSELYYQIDFNRPANNERPPFFYHFRRNNKPAVNLILVNGSYQIRKATVNIGLMTGDYAKYNLAAEPKWLRNIYQANFNYQLNAKWSLDVGILPSHIGLETAINKDGQNLSRSIVAENSPYYETGLKLNFSDQKKWTSAILLLNGWQNIKDQNNSKALGTQIVFKPSKKWVLNSSGFIGNELPDSVAKSMRFFHDFYVQYFWSSKWNAVFILDAGFQGKNKWWGTAFILQYEASSKIKSAIRTEYYNDRNGVIVTAYPGKKFNAGVISCNLDYLTSEFFTIRSELKHICSGEFLFLRDGLQVKDNWSFLFSGTFFF